MTEVQRTPRRSGEARRREIADAALRVISAEGLGHFTALAIAREVGLTDGALFRHFPTKDAIVDAAIDRVEELLFEGFPPVADDPIDRLRTFFTRRVEVIREHPAISRLVASDELARAGSARGVARIDSFRRRSTGFVSGCLAEAEARGLLVPGVGAEEGAIVVIGALLALAHSPVAPPREASAALAPRVWGALETFLRGADRRSRSAGRRPPRRTGRPSRPGGTP